MRCWSIIVSCLLLCILSTEAARRRKLNYCMFNNAVLCLDEPMARFTQQTNGTGVSKNNQEYQEYCHAMGDVTAHCLRRYSDRCASPIVRELINYFLIDRMAHNLKSYCEEGPDTVRERFIRNAECIINKVKLTKEYRDTCVRTMLLEFEDIAEGPKPVKFMDLVTKNCCVLNRWSKCIKDMIRNQCNDEASDVFPNLIRSIDIFPIDFCSRIPEFHPSNNETYCAREFIPKSEADPKGYKSNMYFSHLFNSNCPNVAYGLENHI